MNDREILVPEVEGKTIRFMRLMLTSSAETEIQIDFTDGTSFSSSTCPRTDFEAELYIGGVGEPQILKRYGNEWPCFHRWISRFITAWNNRCSRSDWTLDSCHFSFAPWLTNSQVSAGAK